MTVVERRKFTRVPLNVKVQHEVFKVSTPRPEESQSKNVSVGGIRLVISEKVNVGNRLRLKFSLPGETSSITVNGKIVWVEEFSVTQTPDYKAYDCGIELIDLGPEDKENISRYLIAP